MDDAKSYSPWMMRGGLASFKSFVSIINTHSTGSCVLNPSYPLYTFRVGNVLLAFAPSFVLVKCVNRLRNRRPDI